MLAKVLDHTAGRTPLLKDGKESPQRLLDLLIRIQTDLVIEVVNQADRQSHFEFTAASLVENAPAQAGSQQVQFGFAHRSLEAQEQTIVEMDGAIEAIFVQDQGAVEGTDLQQTVPVGAVACQTRDFQSEHDASVAQAHFGHQLLKTFAVGRCGPRFAQVPINHDNAFGRPTQRDGPLAQGILTFGAFGVFQDLAQGGLAHVEEGLTLQVLGGDL
jgi:hypothetical protein